MASITVNLSSTTVRFASLRVWWHCLRRTFDSGHQMLTFRESAARRRQDFCICGYNGEPSGSKSLGIQQVSAPDAGETT